MKKNNKKGGGMLKESIFFIGESIVGATSVFISGVGILGMNLTQVGYFSEYETVSKHEFVLESNQEYGFIQNENGSISCDKNKPKSTRGSSLLAFEENTPYKITSVSYAGEIENNVNNVFEKITIQNLKTEEQVEIALKKEDYGMSVKARIDLLELCL